jgi:hypothetical protein
VSGVVSISTLNLDPTQALANLPDVPVDVAGLIDQQLCAVSQGSQFVVTGRGGLPDAPTSTLHPGAIWEDWRIAEEGEGEAMGWTGDRANGSSSTPYPLPPTLLEAQGRITAPSIKSHNDCPSLSLARSAELSLNESNSLFNDCASNQVCNSASC